MNFMSQPINTKLFRKKFYQKGNSDNSKKAQSAMEYLMTYGWAILIIAVILAALDFLGVFNTGTFIGPSCLATPGYLCSNPVMTANANGPNLLLFNFKQDSGETLYNVSFACAASSTSQGYPNANVSSTNYGAQTSSNLTVLTSGSSVTVSGLECYSSNGNLFKDNPIGAVFSGTLWIRYNLQGYPPSEYQYAKIAKITAKVESEAAISAMQSSPTQLTFSSLSPSSPSIDTGRSITLTVSWLGGVSPFTVNWLSGTSAGSMSLLSSQTGIISSSLSDSLSVAPTSNTYYSANVIDSSTPPNVVSSPLDLVTVNRALCAPSISASSTALVAGQSVTFSSSWTGGTAPYTAKLYSSSTLPCTSLSSLVQTETTSSNSISFPAITPTQTAYYCIYVNDSSYHSSETENSITQEVTDTTPSTILYYVPIKISNQGGPAPSSVPSGIVSYVPITITNGETVPTSAPFQQMVNITESQFSSYNITYSNTIANFEFFTQSGTVIPAWIESNDSGKLITWVNLPTSIPASSSVTIYIGFASKTTNLLSSSGTTGIGEAPQLLCGNAPTNSCATYAEYDDGAKVFNNYWNFAGTNLSANLSSISYQDSFNVNNGLLFLYNNLNTGYAYILTSSILQPNIIEAYTTTINTPQTARMGWTTTENLGYQNTPYDSYENNFYNNGAPTPLNGAYATNGNDGDNYVPATPSITVNYGGIFSFAWLGTGLQWYSYDYQNGISSNSNVVASSYSSFYGFLGIGDYGYTPTDNIEFQWLRTRAYPPNGVMPTVTFDFPQATGTNFQQMVNITESSFSSYLTYNSNFANFEYFYANGTIIPSWIESNNSGKLVTWAKLSKSIPALSNTTIYLGFAGSNNLLSSSGTTGIGEASQLSSTYAEYDNGASVFNFYDNFAGTSLSSKWSSPINGGDGLTYAVNNGLTFIASTSNSGIILPSALTYSPTILESYISTVPVDNTDPILGYETTAPSSTCSGAGSTGYYSCNSFSLRNDPGSDAFMFFSTVNNAQSAIGNSHGSYNKGIYSLAWPFAGTESASFNYTQIITESSTSLSYGASYLSLSAYLAANAGSITYQWARTRAYPPNGAMPTVTFGSVS